MWQLMQWYVYSSDWSWPYYMLLSNLPIVTIHSQCNLPIHYKESKRNWNLTLYVLVFEYFRLTCQLILPLLTWAGELRSRQVTTTWHLPRLQLHVSVECFRPKVSLHSHFRSQQFLQIIAPVLEFCEWVIFIPFQFPNLGKGIFIPFPQFSITVLKLIKVIPVHPYNSVKIMKYMWFLSISFYHRQVI